MVTCTTDIIAINKACIHEIVKNIKTSMGEIGIAVDLREHLSGMYVFTLKKPVGNGNPSTIGSDIRNRWQTVALRYAFSVNLNFT